MILPSRLPYRAKHIAERVETRRVDDTRRKRNEETERDDETMRRDETEAKRTRQPRPVDMTPYNAGEYGTRQQNGMLDAGNS